MSSDKKNFLIFAAAALLLGVLTPCCLSVGGVFINPFICFGGDSGNSVLIELRFFRILTAFIVGGALAVSGVAYQAVLRNPLAEPFILGISGGASVGAAVAIGSGLAALGCAVIPFASFFGAVVVLALVMILA